MRPQHNNRRRNNNNRGNFNRNNNGGGHRGGRNNSHDSVNPAGGRLRGTAQQLMEKYMELSRAAAASGDSTLAENQSQHAEHYARVWGEHMDAMGLRHETVLDDNDNDDEDHGDVKTYPPVQRNNAPEEQPSLGDFEPPEFLRPKN
jgi:hypothetical protein